VITNDTLQHDTDNGCQPPWRRCRTGAKNLAQVPFSLARDNRGVSKKILPRIAGPGAGHLHPLLGYPG